VRLYNAAKVRNVLVKLVHYDTYLAIFYVCYWVEEPKVELKLYLKPAKQAPNQRRGRRAAATSYRNLRNADFVDTISKVVSD
jgi:hypothetical protein